MRLLLPILSLGLVCAALLAAGCPEQPSAETGSAAPAADDRSRDEINAEVAASLPPGSPSPTAGSRPAAADKSGAAAAGAAPVGQAAPDFTLVDYDGASHTLSQYLAEGKTVVLEWFNPQCGVVLKYYDAPGFAEQLNAALDKENLVWLSIVSSADGAQGFGPEAFKQFQATHPKTNPILADADGTVGHAYGALVTPTLVVIAPDGKVAYFGAFDEASGPGDAPRGDLLVATAADSVLAGQPVAVSQAEAFGCTVKYAEK